MSLVGLIFTIFLFMWKKWAFFGICGMAIIFLILNIVVMKTGIITALFGLVGVVILYLILRPKWDLLE